MGDKKTREQAEAMFLKLMNIRTNLIKKEEMNRILAKEKLNQILNGSEPRYIDRDLVIENSLTKEFA